MYGEFFNYNTSKGQFEKGVRSQGRLVHSKHFVDKRRGAVHQMRTFELFAKIIRISKNYDVSARTKGRGKIIRIFCR